MERIIKTFEHCQKGCLRTLLLALSLLSTSFAFAYSFEVDGIYYSINGSEATVTYGNSFDYNSYSGNVSIPSTVTYNGVTYSVTSIGNNAFRDCTGLASVIIPNSITSIGSTAFYHCFGLASVTIPNSVTSIGASAFVTCLSLSSITFGNSITTIGRDAFYQTPWYDNQPHGLVYAGLVAYKYKGTMPNNTILELRDGTLGIASEAFKSCTGLTSVIIPNSVTSINESAFYNCTGMTSVNIGNSVTAIGNDAFYGCSSLTNIYLTDIAAWCNISYGNSSASPLCYSGKLYLNGNEITDLSIPNSVTSINNYAFYLCSSLTKVTIPNSITSIGHDAFNNCNGLTNVTISNSVSSIGDRAFCNCNGLTNVTIGNSVSSIGDRAFYNCTALETLYYNAEDCDDFTFNSQVFSNTNINTITIGNEVKRIPACFAYELNTLANITIGNSVTSIGNYAFDGCTGLTSVNIGNSVTSIGDYAFYGCTGLTSVNIPESVTTIGRSAFYDCTRLNCITIPNSVTLIGEETFRGCRSLTNVTIGNSVTSIGYSAFNGCTSMTSVNIGNSVASIGSNAFYNCSSLTNIYLTDIAAWCNISYGNEYASPLYNSGKLYLNGTEITDLSIPNSVTSICNYAFYRCSSLTKVTIPNSVTSIGSGAFSGCTGLTSITIPNSVTSISNSAFSGCNSLSFAKLPKTLKSIGKYAFHYCSGLTNIIIPESVTSIGNYAFSGCTSLFSVTIPNSVTSIGDYAFQDCTGLTSATIKSHLTSIGEYAFSNCSALTNLTCMPETPPILNSSYSFNTYNTTSLYVPRSGVENYKNHTNWRKFAKIYEFVGYFTVPDVNVSKGKTVVIPVSMTNEADIIGFQTDIYLPEGFEFAKDGNDYIVDPSDRMARDHAIMCNVSEDGALRVLCYSPTNKVISGNEGELFYVTIKAPNDTTGNFSLWFKNTILTTSDAEELLSPDASTNLNVIPYLPGDANGNEEVSVIDIVTAAQYIVFQNPEPFLFEAADLNNDEQITVTDLALIANLILYPTMNAPKRVPSIDLSEVQIHGNDIYLNARETQTVNITLDNMEKYSAYQMDLRLPDGLTASNLKMTNQSDSHIFIKSEEKDGIIRVLCYSPSLTALGTDDKSLLKFDVTSTGNIVGDIIIDGIELVTTTCHSVHLDTLAISVNQSSTINEITKGKSIAHVDYYNLAGQKQTEPANGVTIIVTTYTDGSRSTQKVIM